MFWSSVLKYKSCQVPSQKHILCSSLGNSHFAAGCSVLRAVIGFTLVLDCVVVLGVGFFVHRHRYSTAFGLTVKAFVPQHSFL